MAKQTNPYPYFDFGSSNDPTDRGKARDKMKTLLRKDIQALESCDMEGSILREHLINFSDYVTAKSAEMVKTSNVIYSIRENIDIRKNIDSLKKELDYLRNIQKQETEQNRDHACSFMVFEAGNILLTYWENILISLEESGLLGFEYPTQG